MLFLFAYLDKQFSEVGSTLKETILLLDEEILSIKSWPQWKWSQKGNERVISPAKWTNSNKNTENQIPYTFYFGVC